jgi:hypothetical protein
MIFLLSRREGYLSPGSAAARSDSDRAEIQYLILSAWRGLRAPVHGDQGFRLEGTTVSGG